MPLSRTTKIVIGVGAGTAILVGVLIWNARRKRAKRIAEAAAAAVAKDAAAEGVKVPPGANAVIKKGIELINLGTITKYQMEALFQALARIPLTSTIRTDILNYFKSKQPKEYAIWNREHAAHLLNATLVKKSQVEMLAK